MLQQHHQEEASAHDNKASPSPSFSSYSSETLAEIAARVIEELRHSVSEDDEDEELFPPWENEKEKEKEEEKEEARREEKEEFEFALVWREVGSPVSADDIFSNGQIKPMYPIFGFPPNGGVSDGPSETRRRLPLGKLMLEEGETASCSSSTDESVDLEVEGAYCVWTPNSVARERKKSNSTGSASKRWKFLDLLLRSHSEGKNKQQQQQQQQQPPHVPFQIPTPKPHNGTDQNKTKSFLPHRPQLVGLFTNVNGLGRNFRPF
ncbi:hypothetical protein Fmac_008838 [Flemingia macrophylla]|uniref:Uncharacterized protein n=1 Tax=Flemingia macrophylla TaxID=520843 RepID=A0ABD1MYM1_9FABA